MGEWLGGWVGGVGCVCGWGGVGWGGVGGWVGGGYPHLATGAQPYAPAASTSGPPLVATTRRGLRLAWSASAMQAPFSWVEMRWEQQVGEGEGARNARSPRSARSRRR